MNKSNVHLRELRPWFGISAIWCGLLAAVMMLVNSPLTPTIITLILVAGMTMALLFITSLVKGREQPRDTDDVFP